jgi:hypothetical protein
VAAPPCAVGQNPGARVRTHTHVKETPDGTFDVNLLNDLVGGRDPERVLLETLAIDRSRRSGFSPVTRYPHVDTAKPILVGDDGIVDGRHRAARLQDEGATHAPAIRVTHDDMNNVKLAATPSPLPDGKAMATGVNPAAAPKLPAAAAHKLPAAAPPAATGAGPKWFSDYKPTPANPLSNMMAQAAPRMGGTMGSMAMLAGLDMNALGTLTRGPDEFAGMGQRLNNPGQWAPPALPPGTRTFPTAPPGGSVPPAAMPAQPNVGGVPPAAMPNPVAGVAGTAAKADLAARGGWNLGARAANFFGKTVPQWTTETAGLAGRYARIAGRAMPIVTEATNYKPTAGEYDQASKGAWGLRGLFAAGLRSPATAALGVGHDVYSDGREAFKDPDGFWAGTGKQIGREAARTDDARVSSNPLVEIPAGVKAMGKLTPEGASGVDVARTAAGQRAFAPAAGRLQAMQGNDEMPLVASEDPRINTFGGGRTSPDAAGRARFAREVGPYRIRELDERLAKQQAAQPGRRWRIDWNATGNPRGPGDVVEDANPAPRQGPRLVAKYGPDGNLVLSYAQ